MTRSYIGWLWLLSGLPVAAALLVMPLPMRLWCFALFVVLETAHSFSPVVLAWTHKGFRQTVIWQSPWKYIGLPTAVFASAIGIGAATNAGLTSYVAGPGQFERVTDLTNPFPLLVWFYSGWNLYHFAMQDFGVLMFCTGSAWRWVKMMGCLVGLIGIYFVVLGVNVLGFWHMPGLVHSWWVPLAMTGVVSVNHWVVDIGLSWRVARHGWVFVIGVIFDRNSWVCLDGADTERTNNPNDPRDRLRPSWARLRPLPILALGVATQRSAGAGDHRVRFVSPASMR